MDPVRAQSHARGSEIVSRRRALGQLAGGALTAAVAAGAVPALAAAQIATPPAGNCGGTKTGSPVSFVGVDGTELGQLSADTVTDPFTGYDPNSPPPRGNRFAIVNVTIHNTGTAAWNIDPNAFALQDSDGFVLRPTNVNLGATPPTPPLTAQAVAAGATAKGTVGFTAVKGTTLRRVIYTPSGDRLLVLADLS